MTYSTVLKIKNDAIVAEYLICATELVASGEKGYKEFRNDKGEVYRATDYDPQTKQRIQVPIRRKKEEGKGDSSGLLAELQSRFQKIDAQLKQMDKAARQFVCDSLDKPLPNKTFSNIFGHGIDPKIKENVKRKILNADLKSLGSDLKQFARNIGTAALKHPGLTALTLFGGYLFCVGVVQASSAITTYIGAEAIAEAALPVAAEATANGLSIVMGEVINVSKDFAPSFLAQIKEELIFGIKSIAAVTGVYAAIQAIAGALTAYAGYSWIQEDMPKDPSMSKLLSDIKKVIGDLASEVKQGNV